MKLKIIGALPVMAIDENGEKWSTFQWLGPKITCAYCGKVVTHGYFKIKTDIRQCIECADTGRKE